MVICTLFITDTFGVILIGGVRAFLVDFVFDIIIVFGDLYVVCVILYGISLVCC